MDSGNNIGILAPLRFETKGSLHRAAMCNSLDRVYSDWY